MHPKLDSGIRHLAYYADALLPGHLLGEQLYSFPRTVTRCQSSSADEHQCQCFGHVGSNDDLCQTRYEL